MDIPGNSNPGVKSESLSNVAPGTNNHKSEEIKHAALTAPVSSVEPGSALDRWLSVLNQKDESSSQSADPIQHHDPKTVNIAPKTETTVGEKAPACEARNRIKNLFLEHRDCVARKVDLEQAMEAYRTRREAKLHPKDGVTRYLRKTLHLQRTERSNLNRKSERQFVGALGVDVDQARPYWGWKAAGLIEGAHSFLARAVTVVCSGVAYAVVGPLAKILLHEIPSFLINPSLSGTVRTVKQVEQIFLRRYGMPDLNANIRSARPLDKIKTDLGKALDTLRTANRKLEKITDKTDEGTVDAAKKEVAEAFIKVDLLQDEYQQRCQMGKLDTIGKGWGAVVNGLGAAGSGVTLANPAAGLGLQIAALVAQLPAGIRDEKNRHAGVLHANAKYPQYLRPGAQYLPSDRIGTEHIDEAALKKAWLDASTARFSLIRTIYKHQLSKLVGQKLAAAEQFGRTGLSPKALGKVVAERARIKQDIDTMLQQIDAFEAAVSAIENAAKEGGPPGDTPEEGTLPENVQGHVDQIDPDLLIGRCLHDNRYCFKKGVKAMLSQPGEVEAQIMQRYAQNFASLVSVGEAVAVHDLLHALHNAPGVAIDATAGSQADIVLNAAGGANFVASTGVVRMDKTSVKAQIAGQSKGEYIRLRDESDDDLDPAARKKRDQVKSWVLKTPGERTIDLTSTSTFDTHLHSFMQRRWRALKLVPSSLVCGPVGAWYALSTKVRRQSAIKEMQHAVALLGGGQNATSATTQAKQTKQTPGAIRDDFIQAMGGERQAYELYLQVAKIAGKDDGQPQGKVASKDEKNVPNEDEAPAPLDLEKELERMEQERSERKRN